MSTITVEYRGLAGSGSVTIEAESSVADLREAAGIAAGLVLRTNGATVQDEANTPVSDEQIFVASAPEAKHGLR